MTMQGEIHSLFIKPASREPMVPANTIQAVDGKGIKTDHAYGKRRRQVLLIELETLLEYDLRPGELRENVVTTGISYAGIKTGTRFTLGEAELEVMMDCDPCIFLESIREGLCAALDGKRGTLCKVIRGGDISVGDPVIFP